MADFTKQKKAIMPFFDDAVQRASQCESVAPIAAYYTRYAGMLKGLDFKPHIHPDIEAVLFTMLSKLEQDKAKLGLATSSESDAAKKAEEEEELRAFALKVFAIADRTDQMGARDAKLLNKYMSARTFLQAYETILDDRPLPAKESELLKYCSVRCYQISKALKSGEPVPPPPAAPGDTAAESASPTDDAALDQELARLEADDAQRAAAAAATQAAAPSGQSAAPPSEATTSGHASSPSWDNAQLPTPPMSQAASPPPQQPTLPPFFAAGAHILYRKDINHMLQHGRIIRTSGATATITTVSSTAEATAAELAPYLPSGSEVMLKPASSSPRALKRMESLGGTIDPNRLVPATVLHDDSETAWPPNYTVRLPDASTAVVSHYDFVAVTLPPGSAGRPHSGSGAAATAGHTHSASTESEGLPSVPPALPGVPKQNYGLAADPADASRYPSPVDLPLAPAITPAQAPQPPQTYGAPPQPAAPPPQAYAPQATASPTTHPAPTAPPAQTYAPPAAASPIPPSAPPAYSQPPPQVHATAAAPTAASTAQKDEAKKQARTAISALNFDDVASAANSLRAALRALGVADPHPGAPASPTLAYKQRDTVHRNAKAAISSMNFEDIRNAVQSLRSGLAVLVGAQA